MGREYHEEPDALPRKSPVAVMGLFPLLAAAPVAFVGSGGDLAEHVAYGVGPGGRVGGDEVDVEREYGVVSVARGHVASDSFAGDDCAFVQSVWRAERAGLGED